MRNVIVGVVLVSSLGWSATPQEGVPLQVRRGFFTETDVGGFFTIGGDNGNSNAQTYVQLGLGYQLALGSKGAIPISFTAGMGANNANCFAGLNKKDGTCLEADNFTMTFLSLSAGYMHQVAERLYLGAKLLGGYTLLGPAPIPGISGGVNVGVAPGIEYATEMDHFSIGVDLVWRMVVGANIQSFQFYPRVKYTF